MKRTLAMLLAVLLVLALFAGCNSGTGTTTGTGSNTGSTNTESGTTNTGSTNTESGTTTEPTETEGGEAAPAEDEGPYHFAKGHFEYNEDGYVSEAYEYELPLSTTDEVFTYWTTCWTPQALPEDGYRGLATMQEMEKQTGVHIEYEAVSSDTRSQNFSVLLASDDLRDIMDQANYFYTGTARSMIDDGWFINFYDYRDYMPNYLFNLWDRHDIDVLKYGRVDDTTWPAMFGMVIEPMAALGYMMREDLMEKWDLGKPEDVKTLDQWHDVLTAFKANGVEWPMPIFKTLDLANGFCAFNTLLSVSDSALPAAKRIDGEIKYCLTTDDDRDAVEMLNKWLSEGLIDPNYASYGSTQDMGMQITTGVYACVPLTPSEVDGWQAAATDADCSWWPTPRVRKTEDQILQYGLKGSNFHMGSACVSAKCENVPLVCTWLDWKWSPDGIILDNWGVEGVTFEWNEKGERQLTDFVLNNPDGLGAAWVMVLYTNDGLRQPCLNMHLRMYAYPGGERYVEMFKAWKVEDYGGEYDIPSGIRYTDEQSEELNKYSNDIATYISENYFAFLDGSKPISEWDGYVADIYNMGLDKCIAVVTEAYDTFMNS